MTASPTLSSISISGSQKMPTITVSSGKLINREISQSQRTILANSKRRRLPISFPLQKVRKLSNQRP
jgi:hypothetical protein